jgi:hypothetical protein
MKIKLKKLIQISTVVALSAATLISCSSDSEEGMLRTIVNSQEEASYTISKSSFNTTGRYFVSVEDDGIYKAYYTSAKDNADSNILDHVKRELYEGTDDLTQILSIYTDEDTSYVVYVEAADDDGSTSTTKLGTFSNSTTSDTFEPIAISKLNGTFKNLTPNGYIITTYVDTSTDEASLYIYSLDALITANTDNTTLAPLVTISNIFSEYGEDDDNGSSRYLDYCVYYDTSSVSDTSNGTADGLIISLTDSDNDNDDYVASDRYYYFSESLLTGSTTPLDVVGGTSTTNYNINIDTDDDDDNDVNAAVVSAHGDSDGANALIITSDGNAYYGNLGDSDTKLDGRWDNSDNSDTFAVHLPSLFFNDSVYTQDTSADTDDYIIGMNSYDYIYVYYGKSSDDRYSTSSDIDVDYAEDLNSSSDIIYIAKIETDDDTDSDTVGGVETYWVATADNGYYTMKIDTANIIEDSDSHSITEGFTYSGASSDSD